MIELESEPEREPEREPEQELELEPEKADEVADESPAFEPVEAVEVTLGMEDILGLSVSKKPISKMKKKMMKKGRQLRSLTRLCRKQARGVRRRVDDLRSAVTT